MKEIHNDKLNLDELNQQLDARIQKTEMDVNEEFQGHQPKKKEPKKRKNGKKKLTKRQIGKRIGLTVLGILLVILLAIVIAWAIGKSGLFGKDVDMEKGADGANISQNGEIIVYKGKKYRYNDNITSILCMGIDKASLDSNDKTLKKRGAGQSDSLFLLVMDTTSMKTTIVNVSRDIMTDVRNYDEKGKYTGTSLQQVCLAYASGDGKKLSCTNTVTAVSKLLYGMPIDSYISIDLSAISTLNDAIGGVSVQVLEDLTSQDPVLKQGANVTLLGDQAETYVRSREHDPVDANNARMRRQQQYVSAFAKKAISEMKSDITLPVNMLNSLSDNAVTNLTGSKILYLSSLVVRNSVSFDNIVNIEGTYKEGKSGYAEYYADDTKLFEMVLSVFYEEVK
ncbi:MAG: LCP family protein [Anaerostipes sp.]|nr:LCP family protein [Anaerostipes sp.]